MSESLGWIAMRLNVLRRFPHLSRSFLLAGSALIAATGGAAAQNAESPAPIYPTDAAHPIYYKDGNGPVEAYFQRWLASNNYNVSICTPPTGTDLVSSVFNPVKCVPLSAPGFGS